VPTGDAFTERQEQEIARALRVAREESGLHFSVFVGKAEGQPRAYAERLHTALGATAPSAVLVFVDPASRRLEIVTGDEARRRLDDRAAALAALSMTTSFAVGDLTAGLVIGVRMLADAARRPRVLHQPSVG
jgi:uncharacterized membrane protein YgcG